MDGTVRCWDAQTGDLLSKIAAHTKGVRCLLIVDDCLWSGSDDEKIKLWEQRLGTKTCRAELEEHTGSVLSLALISATQQVWSASADRQIICWDARNNSARQLRVIRVHEGRVTTLSVGKKYVWSGSDDKTLRVWDVTTGKEARKISSLPGRIWCLKVTMEGKRAWSASGANLDLWMGEGGHLDVPERSPGPPPSSQRRHGNSSLSSGDYSAILNPGGSNGSGGGGGGGKRGTTPSSRSKGNYDESLIGRSTLAYKLEMENKAKTKQLVHTEDSLKKTKEDRDQVEREKKELADSLYELLKKFFGAFPDSDMDGLEDGAERVKQQMARLQLHIQQVRKVNKGLLVMISLWLYSCFPLSFSSSMKKQTLKVN
jgi:hypothetical protein